MARSMARKKEEHFVMLKGSHCNADVTILNLLCPQLQNT